MYIYVNVSLGENRYLYGKILVIILKYKIIILVCLIGFLLKV